MDKNLSEEHHTYCFLHIHTSKMKEVCQVIQELAIPLGD